MTSDNVERDIGRAHLERRDLEKKIACLRHRLIAVGQACTTLANNPLHAESEKAMTRATDPREDWADLRKAHIRLEELAPLLR